jgi:asparagine synthase (glutamine-hydrolysing)
MCGISGLIKFNNSQIGFDQIKQFTDTLSHRGPDGTSVILLNEDKVALGHTRLSILDVSSLANQPMTDIYGRYTIVYNGEVYNFIEIRRELEQFGYNFKTNSDTEVVLYAFHRWGHACLDYFNGMWAMAIWDNLSNSLFLARDRFGIKPLYYVKKQDQFIFSSETNSFSHIAGFKKQFDLENIKKAMNDSFALEGNGKTIFSDIKSLLPGHYLTVDINGRVEIKRWWDTKSHISEIKENYEDQIVKFKDFLFDSCKLRLRSDVPIATALSGGLDSSSVYSILKSISSSKEFKYSGRIPDSYLQAFSAIFPGTEQDEKKYAEFLLDSSKQNITWIQEDTESLVSRIESSVKHLDFIYNTPLFMGASVYKQMSQDGIKVSMDGHGVDEMMYGYGFSIKELADKLIHYDADLANELWDIHSEMFLDRPVRPGFYLSQLEVQKSYIFKAKKFLKGFKNRNPINFGFDLMYNQFHSTMLPTILRNFDKISMQHGIEIRMPFMDYRLVSFVFSLPLSSKIGSGYTKKILRDAMKGLLPDEIRLRKNKMGLNAPMQTWFSGILKDYINDEVQSLSFQSNSLFDGKSWLAFLNARNKKADWSFQDSLSFWPVLNAHLLMKK